MSNNNENILLCDMGGTHARFACFVKKGCYSDFYKYKLHDFDSFESIIRRYTDDTGMKFDSARFALARTPINGVISVKRFAGDPDFDIDFNRLQSVFQWREARFLNDLEAGAYGCTALASTQVRPLLIRNGDAWNDDKIVISVGTGVGHAGIFAGKIIKTCGGHYLPVTVTGEHRAIESHIRTQKDPALSLIMEDFVSARGLRMIAEYVSGQSIAGDNPEDMFDVLKNHPDAARLFFEFLGMHAQNLVSVFGFYGGVYLAGGVIDHLILQGLTDWDAFTRYFRAPMLETVTARLESCPVYYVLHDELPLLGLTVINK